MSTWPRIPQKIFSNVAVTKLSTAGQFQLTFSAVQCGSNYSLFGVAGVPVNKSTFIVSACSLRAFIGQLNPINFRLPFLWDQSHFIAPRDLFVCGDQVVRAVLFINGERYWSISFAINSVREINELYQVNKNKWNRGIEWISGSIFSLVSSACNTHELEMKALILLKYGCYDIVCSVTVPHACIQKPCLNLKM